MVFVFKDRKNYCIKYIFNSLLGWTTVDMSTMLTALIGPTLFNSAVVIMGKLVVLEPSST